MMRRSAVFAEAPEEQESFQRRFPPLRGGEPDATACCYACGGFFFAFFFILYFFCMASLEPNEYGIVRNGWTGTVNSAIYRGGLHTLGPLKDFIRFPAAQVSMEFSRLSHGPVKSRTGADPEDPDSGGQPIEISCSFQYRFVQESLRSTYLMLGSLDSAYERIELISRNMVGNTAQEFTPQDFWHKRPLIAERMRTSINGTLSKQTGVVIEQFQIMQVVFAREFEESITAIQVMEQLKVVNEYQQEVEVVGQTIEVLHAEFAARIANISAAAEKEGKQVMAQAKRDAFELKQTMKGAKYGELRERLGFDDEQMEEYFKIKSVANQIDKGKLVVGLPGFEE